MLLGVLYIAKKTASREDHVRPSVYSSACGLVLPNKPFVGFSWKYFTWVYCKKLSSKREFRENWLSYSHMLHKEANEFLDTLHIYLLFCVKFGLEDFDFLLFKREETETILCL